MKKIIKWIAAGLLVASLAVCSVTIGLQSRRLDEQRERITEQSRVIDSLLTIRHSYLNVELNVTDKSTSKLYGTYNKGTITFPQVRTYRLEIDSMAVKMK